MKSTRDFGLFLALFSLVMMLMVYTAWYLWRLPESNILLWLVKCLPLLLCLPGVVLGYTRVYQWLGFLSMLYFIDGILSIFSLDPDPYIRVSGVILTVGSILLYFAIILFVRGSKRPEQDQ